MPESENIYRMLYEQSLDAILITSPDGNIHAANQSACSMFQRTEEEICRIGREGLVDLSDTRLPVLLEERKRTGRTSGEITMIRKDGTKFPAELTTSVFTDDDAQLRTSMIIRDITGRKRTEKFLIENEARFRSIFENSLLAISIANDDGKLLQVSKAYAKLYGYENPEKMLSEVTSTKQLYAHPEERQEVLRTLNEKGQMEPKEFEVIRRDGTPLKVLVSASEIRDTEGKVIYNMAVHIDITERIKVEKENRLASIYTRSLIEASLDPLVTISAEGKITDVNKATEKITGIKRNKLIGNDFSEYFTEPEKAREGYMRVFTKGFVKDYPLNILHKSSRTTPVLYNATLYKDNNGVVQGVFAAAHDMTVQYKMEEDLRKSGEILKKLNRHLHDVWENEKSQIALNLHDDLGQKFTALILDLAWLRSRIGIQSAQVRNKLDEMKADIDKTIEEIKEISALLRPAILYDLGLIPAIVSLLARFEKQSGISCIFTYSPEEIKTDNRLSLILYRIFQESMTNIVRHSGATSALITLRKSTNKISLCVKDNGVGISKNKVDSLSSMGIIGMKERASMVHGHISIKGEKGKGTAIRVTIPLNKNGKDD